MADDRQDDDSLNEKAELADEARAAVSTLEQEASSPEIQELLRTPLGREVVQQGVMIGMAVSEQHSGPLPSPRQMREYDATVPGAAERIMQMAEREQQHRHEMQRLDAEFRSTAFNHVKNREIRGQTIGALLAAGVLFLSGYLAWQGHPKAAVTLAASTMVAIAAVFAARQWRKSSQPKQEGQPPEDSE